MKPLNTSEHFLEITRRFPESPGVYIMRNVASEPIYIGKAINLKSRVRSYFLDEHLDRIQIPFMLQKLSTIDWIATTSETEALILEANLIRKHAPRFNIDLKDDKHFPYIKITTNEPFPRLLVVRKTQSDGARYLGPFTDVRAMRTLVIFAKKIFKLRDCSHTLPLAKPLRPCINYSMGRCSGACGNKITEKAYQHNIDRVVSFLTGKRKDLIALLSQEMQNAAATLDFEAAATIRDQIALIDKASHLQRVDLRVPDTECDVFGVWIDGTRVCLAILSFREGLLIDKRTFIFKKDSWDATQAHHDALVVLFYAEQLSSPPSEILLDLDGFDATILTQWAKNLSPKVDITIPQKGIKRQMVEMAIKNAKLHLMQIAPHDASEDVNMLQTALLLPQRPTTIEAFDISNLGADFAVAAMVSFKEGVADKNNYRRYKIKTVEGQNDFAMLMESVTRRLTRLYAEQKPFPDLLLIDGGKGQLHAAMEPLARFEHPPMIISLAKKEEIVFTPFANDPIALPENHPARKLLQRIRDEVHRSAITYHRKLRGKRFKGSALERIPGIGHAKAIVLLTAFGSLEKLIEASPEEISKVKGFSLISAANLLAALKK